MDIETSTIDELYEEIKSRCEGCVLIIKKPLKIPVEDGIQSAFVLHWRNFTLSLGLIEQTKLQLNQYYLETFEDIPPSEAGLEE